MQTSFTVLVVEDDTITATIIADAVKPLAKVLIANTSAMAETYAREHKPELILLDISLPDTNGIELCTKLKASSFAASSKVIFVTAEQDHETELNAFSQGADDFIKKPINVATLIARVRLQLNLLKQRQQLMQINQLQSKIFATLPSYVSCWDNNLKNIFNNDVNQAWFTHINETNGFSLGALFTKNQYTSVKRHLVAMKLEGSESFELSKVIIRGQSRTLSVSLISEKLGDGKLGFVMILSDITQQKSELDGLISDSQKYEAALKTIEEGVISTDTSANITYMNRIAQRLTGHELDQAMGKSIDEIMIIKDASDGARLPHSIHYALQEWASVSSLPGANIIDAQGETIAIEELSSPILNTHNEVVGAISVFHDVSHAQQYQSELARLTNHDTLTGLPNRVLLIDRAHQCLKSINRGNSKAAVIIINIDRFRKINERHGYEIGDNLLKEVANFLSSFLRQSDTLARHTGDEFIILLPDTGEPEDVNIFCRNLLHAFAKKWAVGVLEFDLSITMGIAIAPDDANEPQALYRMADIAMHEAKRKSRNNFRFYSSEIDAS